MIYNSNNEFLKFSSSLAKDRFVHYVDVLHNLFSNWYIGADSMTWQAFLVSLVIRKPTVTAKFKTCAIVIWSLCSANVLLDA